MTTAEADLTPSGAELNERWDLGKAPSFLWVVEAFSVVAALAFALSAIGNASVFWIAWRINYFLLADPADVVMSGFIIVTAIVAFSIGALIVVVLSNLVANLAYRAMRRVRRREFVLNKRVLVLLIVFGAVATIAVIASLAFTRAPSSIDYDYQATQRQMEKDIQAFEHLARAEDPERQFGYATGLRVQAGRDLPEGCAGARVLWLGSSAAILQCGPWRTVLHSIDGLVTEPEDQANAKRRAAAPDQRLDAIRKRAEEQLKNAREAK